MKKINEDLRKDAEQEEKDRTQPLLRWKKEIGTIFVRNDKDYALRMGFVGMEMYKYTNYR